MRKSVIKQVIALEYMPIEALRSQYQDLFSKEARTNATRDHLVRQIGYRLQELALGGLSTDTSGQLIQIAKGAAKPAAVRPHTNLLPGTKICREHNGVMHEVEVTKTGFNYQGQPFRSLSAVARKITGTRWNGLRFFKINNGG